MKAVVQRVSSAKVEVEGEVRGRIARGFMVLLGVEDGDGDKDLEVMCNKILKLRVFADEEGKMNRDLSQIGGSLLLVSQFTLCADCHKGNRPSFIKAMAPDIAAPMIERAVDFFRNAGVCVEQGVFGADMQVSLCNDGPVTVILECRDGKIL